MENEWTTYCAGTPAAKLGSRVLSTHSGRRAASGLAAAIYTTYHPAGVVTDMVREQIKTYSEAGYDLAVVSTSPMLDLAPLAEHAAVVFHRENVGFDIGAWTDVLPSVLDAWPRLYELLLVNDSVLGPTVPRISPIIDRMRRRPSPGIIGLTDCHIYAEHLQSYFLLAQGRRALDFLSQFARTVPVLATKAEAIQCGEVALSQAALGAGVYLAAEFGTIPVARRAPLDWLNAVCPPSRAEAKRDEEAAFSEAAVWRRLTRRPVNPTHHLWLPLIEQGFPFVKADLIRRNPGRVPGVEHWAHHWPKDARVSVRMVRDHLDSFGAQQPVEAATENPGQTVAAE